MAQNKRFGKHSRLRKRMDFLDVYQSGVRYGGRMLIIYLLHKPDQPGRLGISVSRKVGKAVVRNRFKRMIREYFRCHVDQFKGYDVVIEVRPRAVEALDKLPEVLKDHVKMAFHAL